MQIDTTPRTKAGRITHLKTAMLAECDDDLKATFGEDGFTIEPLLIQLIRELRKLQEALG